MGKAKHENLFLLMVELADGQLILAHGGPSRHNKILVARTGNREALEHVGQRILDEGLAIGYQILITAGPPVLSYDVEEVQIN